MDQDVFDSVAYDNLHDIPVTTPMTYQLLNWCSAGTTQMLAKDSNALKEWMAHHATYPELADVIPKHILACGTHIFTDAGEVFQCM